MKETEKQFLEAVEKTKQRLAAGETPKDVFDYCGDFHEGLARVRQNSKWNYIDHNGNYLSDIWFDRCYDFYDGFACVVMNDKCNYIGHNGKLLSDTMYEGKILECKGACSWVVDYPKLKELKAQKGE